jgi:hypothetical protein
MGALAAPASDVSPIAAAVMTEIFMNHDFVISSPVPSGMLIVVVESS